MSLYSASVPTALQALTQAGALLDRTTPNLLTAKLTPDMFDVAGQFRTVASFALRATFPLTGQPAPNLTHPQTLPGLQARFAEATDLIKALDPAAFTATEITHRAGFADLTQSAPDYLHHFALPNLWFHLSMAYATLRTHGLPLGKADFDGLHSYPDGFSF